MWHYNFNGIEHYSLLLVDFVVGIIEIVFLKAYIQHRELEIVRIPHWMTGLFKSDIPVAHHLNTNGLQLFKMTCLNMQDLYTLRFYLCRLNQNPRGKHESSGRVTISFVSVT